MSGKRNHSLARGGRVQISQHERVVHRAKVALRVGLIAGPLSGLLAGPSAQLPAGMLGGHLLFGLPALASDQPSPGQPAAEIAIRELPEKLRLHVGTLADPTMEGRGPGTHGLAEAAGYIEQILGEAGLQPGGPGGSWRQRFVPRAEEVQEGANLPAGAHWGEIALENVIGILPGTNESAGGASGDADSTCVVLGAHYDHLGIGPDGRVFVGADDNASGVAALLEMARRLGREGGRARSLVFIAFAGEESGLLGSRHYVANPVFPLSKTVAMINLDTVGRMEENKLYVFGTRSAAEFADILKGINLGLGLVLEMPENGPAASDHVPFLERGVPALHFFTGPNADYHRPSDTAEKVNYAGLASVTDLVSELALYLAGASAKLTYVPPGADRMAPQAPRAESPRRVSLGTIPDFSYSSKGVLLAGTMPGSPAEKAGLKKGDVLIGLGGMDVENLEEFTAALRPHKPGETVEVVVMRGAEQLSFKAVLTERK